MKQSFESVWASTKAYFAKVNPRQIEKAESNPKQKMALVFRWYLENSGWAVQGDEVHKIDMQIWCGPSMGAINLGVKNIPLEKWQNRHVAEAVDFMMHSAAYHI